MSDPLFYVDSVPADGGLAEIDGDEGFHAATVRRLRIGERIVVSDGAGALASAVVEVVEKRRLAARVQQRRIAEPAHPPVTVVQALPKSERSELAIELATEAGADQFVPWQASRCVARWEDAAKAEKGLRRWRAVARSAARQSRRPHIPQVSAVVTTAELVAQLPAGALVLVLHESATIGLPELAVAQASAITVIVGPEGGITDTEIDQLMAAGATAVRLGPTVLRTSTAAAVALGALGALTKRWA